MSARGGGGAAAVTRAFREERAMILATLIRQVGDFQLAEDAVQDAFEAAVGAVAARRRPRQSGCLDHHRRAAAGDRSAAPQPIGGRSRGAPGRAEAPGHPIRGGAVDGRRERDRRRPAAAGLHLLPPGAGAARARGAHPARARRPEHGRDRPRVPGRRADHGQADRARQAQDRRRAHPVPGARRRGAARPPARRPARHLSDLQRGLRGDRGRPPRPRGAVRRGDPARQPVVRADARRRRGAGGWRP